jgi:ABC-type glycerol-3-phosphate transport system substrate-binding protein
VSTLSRRELLRGAAVGGAGLLLAACQPKVVEVERIVERTVVVTEEKIVKEAVEVAKEVTRVVEKAVEVAPAEKPAVTIRIHTNQGDQWYGWWKKAWDDNVAGWRSEHPNITLEFEPTANLDAHYAAVMTHVAAGTLGDIVHARGVHRHHMSWGSEYNIVRDLMPLVEQTGHDLDQYYPGVIAQSTYEGKLYYMPHTSEPTCPVVAYNRDHVEAMGQDEPNNDWTFEDLVEWGTALSTPDVWGYHVASAHGRSVSTAAEYRQWGVKMVSDDGKTALPEDKDVENLAACLDYRNKLIYEYKTMPPPEAEFPINDMMVAGRLASCTFWPVMLGRLPVLVGDRFRIGWVLTPLDAPGSARRSRLHEHVHGLTVSSKNPEEAFETLVFHSSLEFTVQGMLAGMSATVGRPDFFHDPRSLRINPQLAIISPVMDNIEPDFTCANFRGPEFEREWGANYDLVMLNRLSPREGAETIKRDCQDVLNRPIA